MSKAFDASGPGELSSWAVAPDGNLVALIGSRPSLPGAEPSKYLLTLRYIDGSWQRSREDLPSGDYRYLALAPDGSGVELIGVYDAEADGFLLSWRQRLRAVPKPPLVQAHVRGLDQSRSLSQVCVSGSSDGVPLEAIVSVQDGEPVGVLTPVVQLLGSPVGWLADGRLVLVESALSNAGIRKLRFLRLVAGVWTVDTTREVRLEGDEHIVSVHPGGSFVVVMRWHPRAPTFYLCGTETRSRTLLRELSGPRIEHVWWLEQAPARR